jgi:hypothetical protein
MAGLIYPRMRLLMMWADCFIARIVSEKRKFGNSEAQKARSQTSNATAEIPMQKNARVGIQT